MPSFAELRSQYERDNRSRRLHEAQSVPVETVERDSRADLSPKEFVDEKLRTLANAPSRFAARSTLSSKPR
jgi:hypothetical protein